MTRPDLNLHANGRDFVFTENEPYLDYIRSLYPKFKITTTLSLSQWDNVKNSHNIHLMKTLTPNLNANNGDFQEELHNKLITYLDKVDVAREEGKHESVSCVFMSIETYVETNATHLKTMVQANLRAVFIPK